MLTRGCTPLAISLPRGGEATTTEGAGILVESLHDDVDLDRFARIVGRGRGLDVHGLGRSRGRRDQHRQNRSDDPHQSFSTVS